jgi:hypothetical protein
MSQTPSSKRNPIQLELLAPAQRPSPRALREDLVPAKLQRQCVELFAALLINVAKTPAAGGKNE